METKQEDKKSRCPKTGPDSLESWFVVLICGLICLLVSSGIRSSGFYYIAIMETFGVSRGEAMWPISLIGGVINLSGIVTGQLSQVIPPRTMVISGGIMTSTGVMASYFAPNITVLALTLGAMYGLGASAVYITVATFINKWFDKYRGLAMGIAYSGSTVSAFIFPNLNYYLYTIYGLRGCLLISGSILLNIAALGMLLRDPPWIVKKTNKSTKNTRKISDVEQNNDVYMIENNTDKLPSEDSKKAALKSVHRKSDITSETSKSKDERIITIFCSGMYYILLISFVAYSFSFDAFITAIVDFGTDRGATVSQAVSLISFYSITDMVGRMGLPLLADMGFLSRSALVMMNYFVVALLFVALSFSFNYISLLVVCLALGAFVGCAIVMYSVLMADYIGLTRLPYAYGIAGTTAGLIFFSKPAFVGYFRDQVGSYDNMYRLCALFVFLISMLWLGVVIAERKKRNQWKVQDDYSEQLSSGVLRFQSPFLANPFLVQNVDLHKQETKTDEINDTNCQKW